jgi:CheY-like chemotaxis protein
VNNLPFYILYTDDDPDDREILEMIFKTRKDFKLITFSDGYAMMDYLKTTENDTSLVVLDMNMPKITGLEILQKLRRSKTLQDLPVIIFTTSKSKMHDAALSLLYAKTIVKPIHYADYKKVKEEMIQYSNQHPKTLVIN